MMSLVQDQKSNHNTVKLISPVGRSEAKFQDVSSTEALRDNSYTHTHISTGINSKVYHQPKAPNSSTVKKTGRRNSYRIW